MWLMSWFLWCHMSITRVVDTRSNPVIKSTMNTPKRLLKKLKDHKTQTKKVTPSVCRNKTPFFENAKKAVRANIVPGNSNSLWRAVKQVLAN